jgi:glycosyltransferase involved in cell wall biosynthesis
MNWRTQCAAVIPCLNEAATIAALVQEVRQYLSIVIVVDDGSIDETASQAEAAGAEVIHHAATQGKGAALDTGWRRAAERGCCWALSMDGDGQHAAADIPKFLACAERGSAPLIVGNRMDASGAAAMPWLRRRVNQWMSRRLSLLAGQALPDTQCGFRLMDLRVWRALKLSTRHFEIESELLLSFLAGGHAIEFVPIQVIYKSEQSKIHPVQDSWRWFRWWRATKGEWRRSPLGRAELAKCGAGH